MLALPPSPDEMKTSNPAQTATAKAAPTPALAAPEGPAAIHEWELVRYATAGLAERHDGKLYKTFAGAAPAGKQACPT